MPRTQIYASNAERQRAYRERKRQEKVVPLRNSLFDLRYALNLAATDGDQRARELVALSDAEVIAELVRDFDAKTGERQWERLQAQGGF